LAIAAVIFMPLLGACGGGESSTTPVVVTPAANNAPTVASANANQAAEVGIAFNYDATQGGNTFADIDGNTLTYTVSYNPAAQGLTDNSGVLSGTPSAEGTVTVTITANDGNGGTVNDSFDVVIAAANNGQTAIFAKFGGRIDLDNPANYANQTVPNYITKLNEGGNPITDAGATLGRVLFYDPALSIDDTVSCASCHSQSHGFSDPDIRSEGVENGLTGRHSMRLINTQFADEERFFWDERAASHDAQESQPLSDHNEHGFSGQDGRPDFDDLVTKLEALDYYQELFTLVYGDASVTEARLQSALAQFVKSIQSFDSKYDVGRAQVNNEQANFPNFTADENAGKALFLAAPNAGGAGCQGCHRAPEFDIRPNSDQNGVVGVAGFPNDFDFTNTRSPSLRDLVKPDGSSNGPFMHDGSLVSVLDVINHYDQIIAPVLEPARTNFLNTLDNRLRPGGNLQNLNLTDTQKSQLVAYLATLTGENVYQDEKWADPF
jgi:cytochrome c peroxidase